MEAVISRTSAVSGMTMPAMLSAAVVDTCNSLSNIWGCVRPALGASHRDARVAFAKGVGYAPRSRREQARRDTGHVLLVTMVAVAMAGVAPAGLQTTYRLAAKSPEIALSRRAHAAQKREMPRPAGYFDLKSANPL
jgi:hypothetical protein